MAARIIKDYPEISLKPENVKELLDFEDIFGRKAPVHIEIGSGKGTFLVGQARHQPEINFLGIEWANRYYRRAVDRIGRWQIDNVRIIRTDAADFLKENVPDNSISWFHIYFPDPWPKKRHNKRRFFCQQNLTELLRCLKTDGVINMATDHADYFQQMCQVIDENLQYLQKIDFTRSAFAREDEAVGTNFERKYIVDKRTINTIAVKKI